MCYSWNLQISINHHRNFPRITTCWLHLPQRSISRRACCYLCWTGCFRNFPSSSFLRRDREFLIFIFSRMKGYLFKALPHFRKLLSFYFFFTYIPTIAVPLTVLSIPTFKEFWAYQKKVHRRTSRNSRCCYLSNSNSSDGEAKTQSTRNPHRTQLQDPWHDLGGQIFQLDNQ